MEDKIEVREYIILRNRLILGQVIEIKSDEIKNDKEIIIKTLPQGTIPSFKIPISINGILKHSKNIKNLIEVGDYVNGYCVDRIIDDTFCMEFIDTQGHLNIIPIVENEEDIKSIVTKEQFSRGEYKVGE